MSHAFDNAYWEAHWGGAHGGASGVSAHPALEAELAGLPPGTALDAGSGEGHEARWLAAHGWDVTAVEISASALGRAAAHPGGAGVTWVEADLTAWQPARQLDLVTTFYAHPAMPQVAFYERVSRWVAPGGRLLVVGHDAAPGHPHGHGHGHGQSGHGNGHGHEHPENAVAGLAELRALLDPERWRVRTLEARRRTVVTPSGHHTVLDDVIACADRI